MSAAQAGKLTLRLVHEARGAEAFSPLTPPRALQFAADPALWGQVRALSLQAEVLLSAGEHALPLFPAEVLRVVVPDGASLQAEVVVRQGQVVGGSLHFPLPLRMPGIVRVLAALPSLFHGNEPAALLAGLEALRGMPGLDMAALERAGTTLKEFATASLGELVCVELRRLDLEPGATRGEDTLRLRWTGEIVVGEALRIPFARLQLPAAVLPSLHASLQHLLSPAPLVRAGLHREHLDFEAITGVLSGMAHRASGRVSLDATCPPVAVELRLPDQGTLCVDVSLAEPLCVQAEFEAELTPETLDARLHSIELQSGTSRARGTAQLRRGAESVELSASIAPGSRLPEVQVSAAVRHTQLKGGLDAVATLQDLVVGGELRATLTRRLDELLTHDVDLSLLGTALVQDGTAFDDGLLRFSAAGTSARLQCGLRLSTGTPAEVTLTGDAALRLQGARKVGAFPELGVEPGELRVQCEGTAHIEGRVRADKQDREVVQLDFTGTRLSATLQEAKVALGVHSLTLPEGSTLDVHLRDAILGASGLGHASAELRWDLQGLSPVLVGGGERVEIFVPKLRAGALVVEVSPAGGLTITGERGGLYDARFFNALLNPGADSDRLMEVLENEEAMEKVQAVARLFSQDADRLLDAARRFARRLRDAADAEGITKPADGVPGPVIARVLSRVLVGTTALEERLYPLVKGVTDGHGLDVHATKRLLDEALGDHDFAYEVDRGVRFVALLLGPTEPVPPGEVEHLPPLETLPAHAALLAHLPSAAQLYAAVDGESPPSPALSEAIARVAPWLTLEQVDYVLRRQDYAAEDLDRLRIVRELKGRVRLIQESYGGIAFAPQATAIAFFLGETIALSEAGKRRRPAPADFPLPDTLLGPEDLAVLLQAGLASAVQGRTAQLNVSMLLEHVLSRPRAYLVEVLLALSGRSAEVLASVLNALLNFEQSCLRAPLDLPAILSAHLRLELPRLSDFLAGGRLARLSYFEALHHAAERVLAEAEAALAVRCHLQLCRPLSVVDGAPPDRADALAERAQALIAAADDAPSAAAYQAAFAACAGCLAADPQGLDRPWLRAFWSRNYEALVVRSVVRNAQEDIDDVRRWLGVRLGRLIPWDDEQALLDCVLEALYFHAEDRARLAADPLVRLLLDPPAGHYDFTVVSAMGVITEGARGRELETAYARLTERRGVRVLRADTATARSLEFNAKKIEEAVRQVRTPWGFIGYSQGCANTLSAESRLLCGTPEQQALAKGLRTRNLLFSAVNGSPHGTCGEWKLLRAIILGEAFLKHYQALFSAQAAELALQSLRVFLDSRPFVHGMLGSSSLSRGGVSFLHREGRWKAGVPTCHVRGIIEPGTLPEALEWLAHVLSREIEHEAHDTQVAVEEAVGHPVYVRNAEADGLRRCDMGSLVQRTHHWSPLSHETEFVTTERDRAEAIYDTPKDRHVFPWIEVCARFGVIATLP